MNRGREEKRLEIAKEVIGVVGYRNGNEMTILSSLVFS